MIETIGSFVRRALNDERGQVLPWVALATVAILGMGGLSIDVGRAYAVRSQLQNYVNAAALAAAGEVYNTSSTNNSTAYATKYSAGTGDQNANPSLGTVTTNVTTKCLNSLLPSGSSACGSGSPANAVQVTETASLPTYFMRVFGVKTLTVGATATASMQGIAQPWNVAIIEDATGSMATADTNCGGISEFQCALNGIQTLLASTNPCPPGATTCTPATANLRVALFTFPNIITSDLPVANACSGQTFTSPLPYQVYTLPLPGATSYTPLTYTQGSKTWSASYEVTYPVSGSPADADANGFVSDYYQPSNKTTGGLNPSSSIVQAIGYTGTSAKAGCLPVAPAGIALNGATGTPTSSTIVNKANVGEGITYYASAIYAAQAALVAEQAAHPNSLNAIILLSDGQANTQWIYFPQGTLTSSPSADTAQASTIASTLGFSNLTTTPNTSAHGAYYLSTPNQEATGTISGLYPDFLDECQQAIVAAQTATLAGTRVYSVAYGSEQSGCSSGGRPDNYTDVTLVGLPATANAPFSLSQLTPCVTMENIASSLSYFYSDYNQSGSGSTCQDSSHTVVSLQDIFLSISATFTTPRLIPNNSK